MCEKELHDSGDTEPAIGDERVIKVDTALARLSNRESKDWKNIFSAQQYSIEEFTKFTSLIDEELLPRGDASVVVFGSLARNELTQGSDLDWVLLIDGRADSRHLKIAQELKSKVEKSGIKSPGPTGAFGGLAFSHSLVHDIGGQEDTNLNMTRRLLMLLESKAISIEGSQKVRDQVVRRILDRYILEDASFLDPTKTNAKIPRFLLNDVVRFWRTMAVDYANKYRVRDAQGWALRNIKLRMSRKLLFMHGLLMCLSWNFDRSKEAESDMDRETALVVHLQSFIKKPPLETLASVVERFSPDLAGPIFDSYDSFIAFLNNDTQRRHVESLTPEDSVKDKIFLKLRDVSGIYDGALRQLLFESDERITQLVKLYGVF